MLYAFPPQTPMKLIDVTVPIDANLPTYPGNTPFSLEAIKRIASGDSSNVSTIHMSAHAGTHVDAPRHFFDDAGGVESAAARNAVRPDARHRGHDRARAIDGRRPDGLRPVGRRPRAHQDAQLAAVGHRPSSTRTYVGVTEAGARYLVDHGVKVLGVDYLSVEEFKTAGRTGASRPARRPARSSSKG